MADEFEIVDGVLLDYRGRGGDVIIPEGVTEIASQAFYNKHALKSVVIPEGVVRICREAFCKCSYRDHAVQSIAIPGSVKEIGERAFGACATLRIPSLESWLGIKHEGELFTMPYSLEIGQAELTDLWFPNNIEQIPDYAFAWCKSFQSVTIPKSVVKVGSFAFAHCGALQSATIKRGVTKIGECAFEDCNNLRCVQMPESLEIVGRDAFKDCHWDYDPKPSLKTVETPSLEAWLGITFENRYSNPLSNSASLVVGGKDLSDFVVPEGIQEIKPFAFCGCRSLKSVTIPESVTKIGTGAFWWCSFLKAVRSPSLEAWSSIDFGDAVDSPFNAGATLFLGGDPITSLVIPEGATTIGKSTLSSFASIESVLIPEGVVEIEAGTFKDCKSLQSVTIPSSMATIGDDAFYGCNSLKQIVATSLESWLSIDFASFSANPLNGGGTLFLGSDPLTALVVPEGVTKIGPFAFAGCSSIESAVVAEGVTEIGEEAFARCKSLRSVKIAGIVSFIGRAAFRDCKSLKNIVLPEGLQEIGKEAFEYCNSLEKVDVPKGTRAIGDYAFSMCSSLKSATIPGSVEDIGKYVFYWCDEARVIYEGSSVPEKLKLDNSQILIAPRIPLAAFDPDYIPRLSVASGYVLALGEGQDTALDDESRKYIRSQAAKILEKLGYDTIAARGLVQNDLITKAAAQKLSVICADAGKAEAAAILLEAAGGSQGQSELSFPSEKTSRKQGATPAIDATIENGILMRFYGQEESLVIPSNVKSIAPKAFELCNNLKEVTLPEKMKTIGDESFYGCSSLERIIIPEGVTKIGTHAFAGCESLHSLYLPDSMRAIDSYAFGYVNYLEEISFSDGIKSVRALIDGIPIVRFRGVSIPNAIKITEGCFLAPKMTLSDITKTKNVLKGCAVAGFLLMVSSGEIPELDEDCCAYIKKHNDEIFEKIRYNPALIRYMAGKGLLNKTAAKKAAENRWIPQEAAMLLRNFANGK